MNKENFEYHFAYKADNARMFLPFKALMGANSIYNAAFTSSFIIGSSLYLLPKLGELFMSKFFLLTLLASYASWAAFNPKSGLNFTLLKFPSLSCLESSKNGEYYMGAD